MTPIAPDDAPEVVLPAETSVADSWPNPASSSSTFLLALAEALQVEVDVYDIGGRHIRRLLDGRFEAAIHHVAWNHRDDHGVDVPAGVYILRARVGAKTFAKRVVITP
jgi:hypothetical protein